MASVTLLALVLEGVWHNVTITSGDAWAAVPGGGPRGGLALLMTQGWPGKSNHKGKKEEKVAKNTKRKGMKGRN
ncbi:MAG: hypothetical protein WD534_12475 [Phycisphaeraceae bacterium]